MQINKLESHMENTFDDFRANNTQRTSSFLPSIRLKSKQARNLLLEESDIIAADVNSSMIEVNNKAEGSKNKQTPPHKRLNMSMIIPNSSHLTSPLPGKRGYDSNMKKNLKHSAENNYSGGSRTSKIHNRSVLSDRLIDYQQRKNSRIEDMSLHEKFNLDIMNNLPSWGNSIAGNKNISNKSNSKYHKKFNKNSIIDEILHNKSKVLGQKQRLFQLKMNMGVGLPPPPLGKSMGHGILSLKNRRKDIPQNMDINLSTLNNE